MAGLAAPVLLTGFGGKVNFLRGYPINSLKVKKTTEQMLAFDFTAPPIAKPGSSNGLHPTEMSRIQDFDKYGYGRYRLAGGLAVVPRY